MTFPTHDPESDREILRRIYEREMKEAVPRHNCALLILAGSIIAAAATLAIINLWKS